MDDEPEEVWHFHGGDDKPLGHRLVDAPDFDPRGRPWFKEAMALDRTVRTDLYRFASTGEPGVTIARRLDGGAGVVGIDLTLQDLNEILRGQPIVAGDGLMALLRENGEVVAASAPGAGLLPELSAAAAAGAIDRPFVLRSGGTDYQARIGTLPDAFGRGDVVAVAVPAQRFTGAIDAITRHSLVVSLAIVALFTPVLLLAAGLIARPLRGLTREVEQIRRLELDAPVDIRSRVLEVEGLASSLGSMKATLRSFTRFVPKDLVRDFMASGTEPAVGGERRQLSVLFSDIEGFTDFAEHADPQELMRILSAYFAAMGNVLAREGATIDKFIGDAVMAFWNAPRLCPDHAAVACRAALSAQEHCAELNRAWLAQGGQSLRTRFGMHTGEVIVGFVGSRDRLNYTALGATVNLASRLEGLNRQLGTQILISDAIARAVSGRFLLRSAGLVQPKGLSVPLAVFELLDELDAAGRPLRRPELGECVAQFEQGVVAFRARDWQAAGHAFDTVLARRPDDPLARRYRARVEQCRAAPPDAAWTDIEVFEAK